MGYKDFTHRTPLVVRASDVETASFGMSVGRLDIAFGVTPDATQVLGLVEKSDFDLVIVRYDTHAVRFAGDLSAALTGWVTIYADTLVYYGSENRTLLHNSLETLVPVRQDSDDLKDCIYRVFDGYENHYAANERTRGVDIGDAYWNWISSQSQNSSLITLGLVSSSGTLDGCLIATNEGNAWEVLLAGVAPHSRGKGTYSSMIRAFKSRMDELNATWVISTQVWNVAPQRAWVSAGLRQIGSLVTLHLQRRALEGLYDESV